MLKKWNLSSLYFFVVDYGGDLNVKIFKEFDFECIVEISFEKKKSALIFLIIREKGLGLKPCINCDTFAKDPFGVIVQYFDSINGWVLNKVKIREYISLLNTGLY